MIGLLVLVGVGSTAAWLLYHSSVLAVDRIEVGGQIESRVGEILAEQGLVPGVPTISVDPGSIEEALLADPWIAAAQVIVTWPRSVSVDVRERMPVGWVVAGETWMLAARD
ncbi:MAG: FtsQ-type POTRA domain-containing protein, partial [Thermoanaerobaculia bacterium]|nr:FtsQ-type POTRA domain-containing protein [Thermoanaerobaculia bacterium]